MTVPEEAERLYTQVFGSLMQRWGDTRTFQRFAEIATPHAAETLTDENRRIALELLTDGELGEIIKDKKVFDLLGGPERIGQAMTDRQIRSFQAAVDSASLVFMHSAVDAAVSDLCRIALLIAPEDWEHYIDQRKVSLREAKESGYENLLTIKAAEYVTQIERESIMKRADHLFAICQPPPDLEVRKGFKYDRARLEEIDNLRHVVVHGSAVTLEPITTIGDDIEFLTNAGVHLWGMLNRKYDVKLDPSYSLEVFGRGA